MAGSDPDRRTVLKSAGTVGAGAVGLHAATTPGSAGLLQDIFKELSGCEDPNGTPTVIDTAAHFEGNGGLLTEDVTLTEGNTATNYELAGNPMPAEVEDLVVHCHGWVNTARCARRRLERVREAYRQAGYDGFVTALAYDSAYGWGDATEIAERNGPKLGNFLTDFHADHPTTPIRLQGHSLGALVIAEALVWLNERGRDDVVTSVAFLGASIANESVAMDGEYGPAIENAAGHVENFWMDDDTVLNTAFRIAEFTQAVGSDGCDGTEPDNYTDREVDIGGHTDYYKPDVGVTDRVVDTFQTPPVELPPVVGRRTPNDPDGDGLYEAVRGTGEATVLDVQALYQHLDSDAVQNHAGAFDFHGDGGAVTMLDVQALFNRLGDE